MAFVSPFLPASSFASAPTLISPRRAPRARREAVVKAVIEERTSVTQYDRLASLTTIVEDTGEIEKIKKHTPYAATTNPSLVAKAAELPEYENLTSEAVKFGKAKGISAEETLTLVRNKLFTMFGAKILEYIPGDVSTEVDARLSFDVDAQIETGRQIIKLYDDVGIGKERVLIKLATTWEGVQACKVLEQEGIKTNMTLLFSLAQAVAAADAGAYLISPFVGRILDWHKKAEGRDSYPAEEDPGVLSVKNIYNYYKCHNYDTVIMGASFRNLGEILELAGCDRLTISPKFISALKESTDLVPSKLSIPNAESCGMSRISLDEKSFRWMMNEDAMATEKLAEGIRGFANDLEKLDDKLRKLIM